MKPFVFTLMPFNKTFDDTYKLGIKDTCEKLTTYCERVDEQVFQGSTLDRILNQISKADIIIADMSGQNPNVFFEVGYAIAQDKKVIFLTKSIDDIPFDLKHFPHIVYGNSIVKLKEALEKQLKHYLANPSKKQSEMNTGVNLFSFGTKFIEGNITKISIPKEYHSVLITIENISGEEMKKGTLEMVATADDHDLFFHHKNKRFLINQQNKKGYSLFNDAPIFHGAEQLYELCNPPLAKESCRTVELTVLTKYGRSHYTLEITKETEV